MSGHPDIPDALLSVATHRDDDTIRVVLSGEIDMTTADKFETAMDTAAGQNPRSVVVDLADVRFMDSSGIAALVHARTRSEISGTVLTVINCQPPIRRVMEVTGVYTALTERPPTSR